MTREEARKRLGDSRNKAWRLDPIDDVLDDLEALGLISFEPDKRETSCPPKSRSVFS